MGEFVQLLPDLLDQDFETKNAIANALMPIVEDWAGEKLRMTALYGIRYSESSS